MVKRNHLEVAHDTNQVHIQMKNLLFLIYCVAFSTVLTSCGSFGEGFLAGLGNFANTCYYPSASYTSTSSSSYNSGTSALNRNYTSELNSLANQTIEQVYAQEENEYLNFKSQFKKADGSEYTKSEWRALKGEIYSQMNNNRNQSNNSVQNNSNVNASSKKCTTCNGSGRMPYDTFPEQYGLDNSYKVKCNECGKFFPKSWGHTHITCKSCHGKGYYGL